MVISRYSFFKFCMHLNVEFLRQNSKLRCMQNFLKKLYLEMTIPFDQSIKCYLTLSPRQYKPPPDGFGSEHSLFELRMPPPQVWEHCDQGPQLPQPPSTREVFELLETHCDLIHHADGPHGVPSAQGMCWVRHPLASSPPDVVHQRRPQGGM